MKKFLIAFLVSLSFAAHAVDPELPVGCDYLLQIVEEAPDYNFIGMNQKIVKAAVKIAPAGSGHNAGDVIEIVPSMCISLVNMPNGAIEAVALDPKAGQFVACKSLAVALSHTSSTTTISSSSSSSSSTSKNRVVANQQARQAASSTVTAPARTCYLLMMPKVVAN